MNTDRQWFIDAFPLPEFAAMLTNFVRTTQAVKQRGTTKGTVQKYEFSTGLTLQQRYGMGAPSKTSYINWHVVNIYYDTDAHMLHVAIQDNEEREVLGKNIGAHPDLVAQALHTELPGKGFVYSFLQTTDAPSQQDIEDIYDIFMDLCGRISEIIPAEALSRWNFGDSKPGHVIKKTTHEERLAVRKSLTLRRRYEIFVRDNYTCQQCRKAVSDDITLHVDHIIPVSRGGTNDKTNLRALCSVCNIAKSAKLA